MSYFSLQGIVTAAERASTGWPMAFKDLGNAPTFNFSLSVDEFKHKESRSGQKLTDFTMTKEKSGEANLVLEEVLLQVAQELGLYATVNIGSTTPVTGENISNGDTLAVGNIYALRGQNVSAVTITDSTGSPKTLTAGTHYTLDANSGEITLTNITTGGPYVAPLIAAYTPGARTQSALFTKAAPERWVRLNGVNLADNNRRVIVDLYKVKFSPAKQFDLITDELASMELTGAILADLTKPADTVLGQFGRITYI